MKAYSLPLLALLALTACEKGAPEDEGTNPATATQPTLASPPDALPLNSGEKDRIPLALLGRWGMVPADCEPGRADAKGLLTITDTKLEFYESVAKLDSIKEIDPSRIRASFDFTGEGMEWDSDLVLDVQDNGATLIRQDYGDQAPAGPFRYSKCT